MKKIAFIGAGRMAEALIGGLLTTGAIDAQEIVASDVDERRLNDITQRYSIVTTTDNREAAAAAEFILLAVKPQHLEAAVLAIRPSLSMRNTIISIAAGVPTQRIRSLAQVDLPVVRVMPNAPALVNEAMSAVVLPAGLDSDKKAFVELLLKSAGEIVYVDENEIDAVTAVSGSGPAYFFLFVRELAKAGEASGLSKETALTLARQTFVGAARLLDESGLTEDELIAMVASPGGTTEAAIEALSSADFDGIVHAAVAAAIRRAKELAKA